MDKGLLLDQFLIRNRIDKTIWDKANIKWETLQEIACDHDAQSAHLESSAEFFTKIIQKFQGVHSVRWRVKNSEHLLKKIIRKRSEENLKYSDITPDNYFECITDLIGVRALHLFKENCFEIDCALKSVWTPNETPVAYIREGDSGNLKSRFHQQGFEVKNHPAGYRSVHYVIQSAPLKRTIFTEIQVRTIFEEGWSEIDHQIRYPDFSDNVLVEYFLEIFNRMAGSADDMGGFVLGLVATLGELDERILIMKNEKEATFKDMEQVVTQLENVKQQDKASRESIAALKQEIEKLKKTHINGGLNLYKAGLTDLARQALDRTSINELMKAQAANYAGLGLSKAKLDGLLNPGVSEQVRSSLLAQSPQGLLSSGLDLEDLARVGLRKKLPTKD